MRNDKGFTDNRPTRPPVYFSNLTIQSPTNRYFFKNGGGILKVPQTSKTKQQPPTKEQEIRIITDVKFNKCRMNYEYKYDRKQRNSSHSSQMEEFKDLKHLNFCNLAEQNKKLNRSKKLKHDPFKINTSTRSLLRKKQGHSYSRSPSPSPGLFILTSKNIRLKRDQSPISVRSRLEINQSNNRSSIKKDKIKTIQLPSKYISNHSPYSRNSKHRQHYSSEDSFSQNFKSYSTLKLNPKPKKQKSTKMVTLQYQSRQQQKKSTKKRKRIYSHQKL